uniref:Uncharacterized protein n=1 Tax=Oryza rufipogon TaxID=4529 RepID=A0A0E0P518_ORYRU
MAQQVRRSATVFFTSGRRRHCRFRLLRSGPLSSPSFPPLPAGGGGVSRPRGWRLGCGLTRARTRGGGGTGVAQGAAVGDGGRRRPRRAAAITAGQRATATGAAAGGDSSAPFQRLGIRKSSNRPPGRCLGYQ